jgi:hypothetical protein
MAKLVLAAHVGFNRRMTENLAQASTGLVDSSPNETHGAQIGAGYEYPLTLSFKLLALASQAYVRDRQSREVFYTRQKMLKLCEHVEIWRDSTGLNKLADLRADRMLDWSAFYQFTDTSGATLGGVGRKGWRSIWRASYEVYNRQRVLQFMIQEENPWTKVFDSLFQSIPLVSIFAGYVFHPAYVVKRLDGTPVMRVTKQAAFFEGKYRIEKLAELDQSEEPNLLLAVFMMLLLERQRG